MITPSFSPTATERVLPKLALDFTTASLDSRVTFTRTTDATHPATYTNSSGYVTSAMDNQPRFDYSTTSIGTCKGLLIEESRANIFLQSENLSVSPWVSDGATSNPTSTTSPANTNTGNLVDGTTGAARIYQSATISGSTTYTFSVFVKYNNGYFPHIEIVTAGGANPNVTSTMQFNFGAPAISGSATNLGFVTYPNGWYRIYGSFTSSASHNVAYIYCYPGQYYGSINKTYFWGAQLEAGAFPTSYIPTTTTALTRNTDVATMTGTNFSSWFNASEGAFQIEYIQPVNFSGNTYIFAFSAATDANQLAFLTGTQPRTNWYCNAGGSNVASVNAGNTTLNSTMKQVGAYKVDSYATSVNGSATQLDTSGAVPTGIDRAFFGTYFNGNLRWSGWLRKLNYWPQRLINNEVQAFSK